MPRPSTAPPISAQQQQDQVSEGIDNFELPKSLVTKIAKSAATLSVLQLPENAKLQKDVVLSLVKSSTVFINYLAATAHDIAQSKQHKSISASDVLKALEAIEFGDIVSSLLTELQNYRENAKSDKGKKPAATKARVSGASATILVPPKAKAKGKAKVTESISATTAEPAPVVQAEVDKMDVDEEINAAPPKLGEVDEEMRGEGDGEEVDQAMVDDDEVDEVEDEDEPEELVDTVALEEEELRKDAKGLDDDP